MSEQDLWIAVIHRALEDAISTPDAGRANTNVTASFIDCRAARNWFKDGGRDFVRACTLAGLDPAYVRDGVLRMIRDVEAA
jgi:hypothetical protein